MRPFDHIYLSPHLDDAVLSCGGRIWQQARAGGRVLVVTVFASPPAPGAPLSPFARSLHARWGHPAGAVARRQEEDRAAVAILGAQAVHWPYADCIYRQAPGGRFLFTLFGFLGIEGAKARLRAAGLDPVVVARERHGFPRIGFERLDYLRTLDPERTIPRDALPDGVDRYVVAGHLRA